MKFINANTKKLQNKFYQFPKTLYKNNPFYKDADENLAKDLCFKKQAFHKHAIVESYLIYQQNKLTGRFSLICDELQNTYCQVAFLEFSQTLDKDFSLNLTKFAKKRFPNCKKIIVGLNGHLNYVAGILLNKFDKIPSFGLPYTNKYYPKYFQEFSKQLISTFKFQFQKSNLETGFELFERFNFLGDYKIRKFDLNNFSTELKIYTDLNNKCFLQHPFWTKRTAQEDFELFSPFLDILKPENLLFAEYKNIPIGFLLWLPDFNQLHRINLSDLNIIDTFRLIEIAVLSEFHRKGIELLLFIELMKIIYKTNYQFCEGGFIFNENIDSINMTKKYIKRFFNQKVEDYRQYAVFEYEI